MYMYIREIENFFNKATFEMGIAPFIRTLCMVPAIFFSIARWNLGLTDFLKVHIIKFYHSTIAGLGFKGHQSRRHAPDLSDRPSWEDVTGRQKECLPVPFPSSVRVWGTGGGLGAAGHKDGQHTA